MIDETMRLVRFEDMIGPVQAIGNDHVRYTIARSKAQLKQDLFVLATLNFKRNGYFVEFGATSGVDISNTCLLEFDFGWRGILAEQQPSGTRFCSTTEMPISKNASYGRS